MSRILLLIVGCVSITFIVAGAYLLSSTYRLLSMGVHTRGTVVHLEYSGEVYYPRVSYRLLSGENIEVLSSSGSYPPAVQVGDEVSLFYNPDDPTYFLLDRFDELYLFPLLLLAIGLSPLLFYGFSFLLGRRRRAMITRLLDQGFCIDAKILEVKIVDKVNLNERSPYQVIAEGFDPSSGVLRRFESEYLWEDPGAILREQKSIKVYLDPQHPRQFFMDLRFLSAPDIQG